MAMSGLERKIQYLKDEIEDVKHELEGQRRQFEMLRREVLTTRSHEFTPRARSPPKSPEMATRKPKKKPMDLRKELLRHSPGVREYEHKKRLEEEERRRLDEYRRVEMERMERTEFEMRKAHRLAELEELGTLAKYAIRMLENKLADLEEQYELFTKHRSKGETTGRGRKVNSHSKKKNKRKL